MRTTRYSENPIPNRWLPTFRVLWLGIATLLIVIYFSGVAPRYAELSQVCEGEECAVLTLTPEELQTIENFGLSLKSYAFFQLGLEGYIVVLFSALAGLVFWRRSDTWLGYVVSLGILFGALIFFAEESRTLTRLYPNLQGFVDILTSVSVILMLLLFFIFPDGRFVPRWTRWAAAALVAGLILDPLVIQSNTRASSGTLLVIILFAIGAPLGVFSQIHRFQKVSNPAQRQQTKWILFGFLGLFSGMLPWLIFIEIAPLPHGMPLLIFYLGLIPQYILIGLFPITIAISILRYRLWDIDLVIRRTLSYTLLTGVLGLVYFGGIVVLQTLFAGVTGRTNSPLITVVSTLTIAALFNPLRTWVQDFIDRRFYRAKYDAEQALTQFATTAREEVDVERLSRALLGVAEETMQPERASLWIVPEASQGERKRER